MANGNPQEQPVAVGGDYADIMALPPPGAAAPVDVIGGYSAVLNAGRTPLPEAGPGTIGLDVGIRGVNTEVYFAGDEIAELRALTTEDRVRLQEQLVAVGLASEVFYGEIDEATVRGFASVLAMANRSGDNWRATLGRLATSSSAEREAAQEFEPQPYLKPDYATLAQRVKQTFRDELGRDPDDYEMQQLTAELSGFDALAYEREQELAAMAHGQQVTPGVQAGGAVTAVDPLSRFREIFEQRYAGELDFVEDKKEAAETQGFMEGVAGTVAGAARSSF